MSHKAFPIVIALVLLFCVVCPVVELAVGWNDTLFVTGYDGESTLSLLVLLLELVLALVAALTFYLLADRILQRLKAAHRVEGTDADCEHFYAVLSPPLPLRI